MGKLIVPRGTLKQLAPLSQKQKKPYQLEKQWKVVKAHDTRLILRACQPAWSSHQPQAALPLQTRKPLTTGPSLPFPTGVKARRRPVEDFVDELADEMGFGGPSPPSSSSNYYDLPLGYTADDDAQLATLLGFPVCRSLDRSPTARPQTPGVCRDQWREDDPAPGFTQVMDAPDLSNLNSTDPEDCRRDTFLDTSSWHPESLLLEGTKWEEPPLFCSLDAPRLSPVRLSHSHSP